MKLYVGNFTYTMTEPELKEMFSLHGRVESVKIITDHFTRQSKCFAYVEMKNSKDALRTVEMLHGTSIDQQVLVVKEARSRDDRQGRPW